MHSFIARRSIQGCLLALVLILVLSGPGCARSRVVDQRPCTIVMLPDTQHYSRKYPDLFYAQTDWVRRNRDKENIAFVTQVGDLVNDRNKRMDEWDVAGKAMWALDGVVPWGVALGNHDYDDHGENRVATGFLKQFGPERFKNVPWYGGASPNGLNSYQLFSASGVDFIAFHLEVEVPDPAIAWASGVLNRYPKRAAIVSTHSYLYGQGGIGRRGRDEKRTDNCNSAEETWNKLVRRNPQIFMVLCGHVQKTVEYHQVSINDAGNRVLEMLADYQKRKDGGEGWLRLIRLVPASREIQVRTYSPVLDKFETDADSEFTVPWESPDLRHNPRRVASKAFGPGSGETLPERKPCGTVILGGRVPPGGQISTAVAAKAGAEHL
jgi:hypothetical protein